MTMPHLMNCSHSGDGWCLACCKLHYSDYLAAHNHACRFADLLEDAAVIMAEVVTAHTENPHPDGSMVDEIADAETAVKKIDAIIKEWRTPR